MLHSDIMQISNGRLISHIVNGVEQVNKPQKPPPYVMDSTGRLIYTASGDNEPTLTPGAYLAKQRGCTCSRLDNDWGWGRKVEYEFEGIPGFIDIEYLITPGCPLHDTGRRVEFADDSQDQRPADQLPSSD